AEQLEAGAVQLVGDEDTRHGNRPVWISPGENSVAVPRPSRPCSGIRPPPPAAPPPPWPAPAVPPPRHCPAPGGGPSPAAPAPKPTAPPARRRRRCGPCAPGG